MKKKIGEICKVDWGNTSLTKKSYVDSGKYLAVSATGGDGRLDHFEHEADVCVLSAIGAQCGKMFFPQERFTAIKNTITLTSNKDKLFSKYLYYFLTAVELPKRGAAQPFISKGDIEKFEMTLPPLVEQQRIVAKLDAAFAEIDETIKITDDKVSNYTDLSSGIMREILNDDSYRWETKSLSHLSENLDAKRIPITKSKRAIGKVPYYGASGIVDYVEEYLFDDDFLLISEDGANLLMRTYPIAFSVSGKCWVNNHAHVLKFENPKLQEWVELYLNATNLSPYISGMAQPKLNQKKLNEIPIPCPDAEMLERLLNKVASAKKYVEKTLLIEAKKTTELKKLKSAILAQELQSEAT